MPRRTFSAVIVDIYRNPNACLITNVCSIGFRNPFFLCRFRFSHGIESLGKKSSTLGAWHLMPRVAANIVVFADIIAAIDAVCSQCDPNGSH
jgi:hypothetical protein